MSKTVGGSKLIVFGFFIHLVFLLYPIFVLFGSQVRDTCNFDATHLRFAFYKSQGCIPICNNKIILLIIYIYIYLQIQNIKIKLI